VKPVLPPELFLDNRAVRQHFQKMRIRRFLLAVLTLAVFSGVFALRADEAYANWIRPWSERPATSPAFGNGNLKLVVSRVRGEKEITAVASMTPVERLQFSYRIQVSAAEVSGDGGLRTYFVSNTDTGSSPVRPMAAADFQQLDALLNRLPDDGEKLPPAGNRVVVQNLDGGRWHVRVYDGKNLPAEVKDLMALLAQPAKNLF
jgi:hypothetical protein